MLRLPPFAMPLYVFANRIRIFDIQEVLRNINSSVYGEIDKWVRASFDAIRAHHKLDFSRATSPYPILDRSSIAVAGSSRQISTALLFTSKSSFLLFFGLFIGKITLAYRFAPMIPGITLWSLSNLLVGGYYCYLYWEVRFLSA